ncbi:hypothetical protein CDD81_5882 [Ophiocordyceps australis]|uniref:Antigenic cell wall galactomannoprotein n=1 Tax=Ophiocordyceps australis TaxID=1399860 RepID=A0A2C5YGZ2_9HYPO|nr:hypothetical protein CDD81_5882 [Ophiocordyceps australis]
MLFSHAFVALATIVSPVLANGAAINSSISTIQSDVIQLGTTTADWNGHLLGALPIVAKAGGLYKALKQGTRTADASAPLSTEESLGIATSTGQLATEVNKTLDTIIAAKPKFDHLLLSPILSVALELEKDATDEFADAVVAKVPQELQPVAKNIIQGIQDSFAKAISAYS